METLTTQSEPDACVATSAHETDVKSEDYVSRTESGCTRMLHAVDFMLQRSLRRSSPFSF